MSVTAETIIAFWLEAGPERWYTADPDFDALIRERFLEFHEQAARGDLAWSDTGAGTLALLLLLDQFPRNIFRDDKMAFVNDGHARRIAEIAINRGLDKKLSAIERVFLYLPLEHAENLEDQRECVRRFEALAARAPEPLKAFAADILDFARRHERIVARFGRVPHRNAALGRTSTPEEAEFLRQPGSGF